ncbi:hypothetical protein RFI_28841 [Reticulomyxa filosa]|uniref:RanBP2-type domain-containing protein n=1 Tax=Reticulomyxa filosa TaxID=46433 RepID=X6M3P1_RETFI|nr:hypothetical protein RFI_28841 [Reticulomyxa filosa]|eukprot:ETO08544.1 hypothetical protein RFI_28841 [Reticulomyxa filosa]
MAIVYNLPKDMTETQLYHAIRAYQPVSTDIVRNETSERKNALYGLVRFESISKCIDFVENNEFNGGEFFLDSDTVLELNYVRTDSELVERGNLKAGQRSDWLCHECYYHNMSNKDRCSSCKSMLTPECTRISPEGHPLLLGEVNYTFIDANGKTQNEVERQAQWIDFTSGAVVVVEGVSHDMTEAMLAYAFQPYAAVVGVYISKMNGDGTVDEHGVPKLRRAFIQFATEEDSKNAIKQAVLHNVTIANHPIHLALVKPNLYVKRPLHTQVMDDQVKSGNGPANKKAKTNSVKNANDKEIPQEKKSGKDDLSGAIFLQQVQEQAAWGNKIADVTTIIKNETFLKKQIK